VEYPNRGNGSPGDDVASLRWFRRAATRGHAGAAYRVGWAYWWGACGAPRDRARAAPFLLAAARQGEPRAAAMELARPERASAATRKAVGPEPRKARPAR
jgi:uncharacterized protein